MNKRLLALRFVFVMTLALAAAGCGPSAPSPAPTVARAPTLVPPTPPPTATPTPMPPTPTPSPTRSPVPPTATRVTPTSTFPPTYTPVPPTPTPALTSTTPVSTPATTLPAPTASLTHTSTPAPGTGPRISYFRANVSEADPGDTITLEWQSSSGTQALLYHLLLSGQFGRFWEVEPSGSMDYVIPTDSRNWEGFSLYVFDDAERSAQATLAVKLRCPDEWFFSPAPEGCPRSAPIYADGAEQHFERGVMLWNSQERMIYALFDDSGLIAWRAYVDEWQEGDPASDPSIVAPTGLYQPVRGFGRIWREIPDVRDRLGWAVGAEASYPTTIQRTSRFKYNDTYISALDGGVWELKAEGSEWSHFGP